MTGTGEADHQHRQVAHAQLTGPGPEPGHGLADRPEPLQAGRRLQPTGHRGPDQQLVAPDPDEVLPSMSGHGEQGLVDVDDQTVFEPDDEDRIRAPLQELRERSLHIFPLSNTM
jgi:hypothetical protein